MINILVVEDDKHARKLFETILKRAGFSVFTAEDGLKAIDLLDTQHIDLIIVDIMMPNMDGYEFTKHIRNFNTDIPLLMVTAKHLIEDKKKGFNIGIDDYMTKPIDTEELVLRVQALLRRYHISNSKKIVIGNITLDYDTLTLTRNNEKHTFPQKEFYLLYKLLSYPDKIFTRIQLMDEIWGMETESDTTTVNVHINRLRKKIADYDEFEILSVRGLGYKAVKKHE